MVGIGEPPCQSQPVLRLIGREGGQNRRRVGLDRLATIVVIATVEHVGHLRLRRLPHHHDLLRLLGEVVANPPGGLDRRPFGCGRRVEGGSDIAADQFAILLRSDDILDRTRLKEVADLQARQTPVEDTEVVHQTVLEAVIPHPFANANVVATAARDLPREAVADHLRCHRIPIHENFQTCRFARAIARNGHMHPLAHRQRLGSADRNRIPRPEVNERPLQVAVEHQKFIATARRIGPGL